MRAIAGSGGALAAVAQLADGGVGDPQLDRGHALAAGEQLLLLVGRGAGDREHGAGAVDQGDAGVEHRAAARATAGRPAPDSTASESASSSRPDLPLLQGFSALSRPLASAHYPPARRPAA